MPTTNGRSVMYRSKPNPRTRTSRSSNPSAPASGPVTPAARPRTGGSPFRLLDLPPELRHVILEHLVGVHKRNNCHHRSLPAQYSNPRHHNQDIRNLSLSCLTLYRELANIIYRNVVLDMTEGSGSKGTVNRFLVDDDNDDNDNDKDDDDNDTNCTREKRGKKKRPSKRKKKLASPRLARRMYVRNLHLVFFLEDQLRNFSERYADVLRAMAKRGNLEGLRIDIDARFPSCEFFGGGRGSGDDNDDDNDDEGGNETGQQQPRDDVQVPIAVSAGAVKTRIMPALVVRPVFQAFLSFLAGARIPKIGLFVMGDDHLKIWCPYHRKTDPFGASCDGWGGGGGWGRVFIPVAWKVLVKELKGAMVIEGAAATATE